ncbi:hypothetical protein [Hymenobacter coccineus]|uniref:Uncharacterized protein n=1 Tax=Hymenobacter coccineus TaxID=1908235 RepID=A0A1G1TJ50_9BACT|nr:hypothetical protein [Hymenobacter coccineus]OGX90894.1 hypothetical protein BEN49_06095 [Hymenobacter coccineus]
MESELTTFLTTIDTPAFRRDNLAKVRAKAAAAKGSGSSQLSVSVPAAESVDVALPTTHLQAVVSGK